MSSLLHKLITSKPTPRVNKLRDTYLSAKPSIRIDVDRIIARVMKETERAPMVLRRARSFAAVVREIPINILPDELFVGWIASEPSAMLACAEQKCESLETQLDDLETISDEDKRELREEIIPFWREPGKHDRTWAGRVHPLLPQEAFNLVYPSGVIGELMREHHVGHSCYGYEKVLKKGFLGIKKDAKKRLNRLDLTDPEALRRLPFLKGVVMAMEAAAEIGKRFAHRAREMARKEQDAARKAELKKIAEVCDRVPANPARTFHEALQSVWFTHIMNWWETPLVLSISPGRVDQYLWPFYESDIREGRLKPGRAQELIDCWLMRFSQDVAPYSGATGADHHIDAGGLRPDGTDATNELSFMLLEGMMHTRLVEPNFGVLVHSRTPDDFLIKACQLCSLGTGHPMFLNHDTIVENLLARGTLGGPPISLEQARGTGVIGCNEPQVANMDSGYIVGCFLSIPTALELALSNGFSRISNKKLGLKTGDARRFESFEEVQEAFQRQLAWLIRNVAIITNTHELSMAEIYPTVYQSALIEDCIEKGVCREEGGARYNFGPAVWTAGAVDVGDSLTAIKSLVFDQKKITMDQLLDALKHNFEGHDLVRRMLLNAPKFGNDDDYADEEVSWVMHVFSQEVVKQKNTRGGHLLPMQIPLSLYVPFGMVTGAMPSGRKAGEPLSDGIAPTRGSDVNGPTAVINSVGKINNVEVFLGQTFNMRLSAEVFSSQAGIPRLASMIRTFIDQKIHQIQINIISSDTLRAAQERPDQYRDLTVRVAGYCAYFVTLNKPLQDSIIARTEHGR